MNQTNSVIHIDPGSMSVFATQILEAVDDALAVAVYDKANRIVWAGTGAENPDAWTTGEVVEDSPGVGIVRQQDDRMLAYVFDLKHGKSDRRIGTLGVLAQPGEPKSLESVFALVEPMLRCVERQIDINAELSSVRRVSDEARLGMKLLVELDEIDESAGPDVTIREVLERTGQHFSATLSAALLPAFGIQVVDPKPAADDTSRDRQLMGKLGSLMSKAKMLRKVMRSTLGRSHIVSTPIFDSRDEVIGIYVIAGRSAFSRDQIRVFRAVAAKISALASAPETMGAGPISRHDFLRYADEVIRRESTTSHAMLVVDIDKLHVVNENSGHMAGDSVIRKVNRVLNDTVRRGDIVASLGSDVFGIFLRSADESDVIRRAEFILRSVADTAIEHESRAISVTVTIGIAMIPQVVADAEGALSTAEVATRSGKDRGGNRLVVFRDLDASVMQRRSDLDQVGRLQAALLDDRFVLFAQPIKPLQAGETAPRYEILVRMVDEDGKILPPHEFLSAAERYQMMGAIDRWVVRRTLDQLSAADNPLEIGLGSFSINVSAQSLMDREFLEFVESQIAESGVPPDALCFEITETSVVRSLEMAQYFISRLRNLGCRVALDDFGTGYCSFAYLKDLHVQYVKIDGIFVRDILENPLSEAIVVSLARIAEVMPAAIVAEHVETDLVIQRLRQHGVGFAQGFGIGKPRPLEDVLAGIGPPIDFEEHTSKVRIGT